MYPGSICLVKIGFEFQYQLKSITTIVERRNVFENITAEKYSTYFKVILDKNDKKIQNYQGALSAFYYVNKGGTLQKRLKISILLISVL